MDNSVFFAEFIATFVLVLVILCIVGRMNEKDHSVPSYIAPFVIGIAIVVCMFIAKGLHYDSPAHVNPAVTIAMTMNGKYDMSEAGSLIVVQLLAAVLAYFAWNQFFTAAPTTA